MKNNRTAVIIEEACDQLSDMDFCSFGPHTFATHKGRKTDSVIVTSIDAANELIVKKNMSLLKSALMQNDLNSSLVEAEYYALLCAYSDALQHMGSNALEFIHLMETLASVSSACFELCLAKYSVQTNSMIMTDPLGRVKVLRNVGLAFGLLYSIQILSIPTAYFEEIDYYCEIWSSGNIHYHTTSNTDIIICAKESLL